MQCSKCGSILSTGFKFCPNCGNQITLIEELNLEMPMAVTPTNVPKLIPVQGGTFLMGPLLAQISLSSFSLGEVPVTQMQYEYVMQTNPSKLRGENHPVECVTWIDAIKYCNNLSLMRGCTPCYTIGQESNLETFDVTSSVWKRIACNFSADGYRLPTEAEWEFAARGGKNNATYHYSGSDKIDRVAWYGENSNITTHNVSTKSPNILGLYDMSGNVAEWCWDYMEELGSAAQANPRGPKIGNMHIKRGGSWLDDAEQCVVTYRSGSTPTGKSSNLGFRVCRSTIGQVMK